MHSERLIGLFALIGTFTLAMYIFYPDNEQADINRIESTQSNIKTEILDTKIDNSSKADFQIFTESDFDFFVYRAHVLSSKENANKLKIKINNGGYPAFVEVFGDKKELFAVYVGPFLSEDDIVNNMRLIQELSESKNGEISRWKL